MLDRWDVLFVMQHYWPPLRLLGWTEVLYTRSILRSPMRTGAGLPRSYAFQANDRQPGTLTRFTKVGITSGHSPAQSPNR
jgi:hypothetical protein